MVVNLLKVIFVRDGISKAYAGRTNISWLAAECDVGWNYEASTHQVDIPLKYYAHRSEEGLSCSDVWDGLTPGNASRLRLVIIELDSSASIQTVGEGR